jgi:hypothetical protein
VFGEGSKFILGHCAGGFLEMKNHPFTKYKTCVRRTAIKLSMYSHPTVSTVRSTTSGGGGGGGGGERLWYFVGSMNVGEGSVPTGAGAGAASASSSPKREEDAGAGAGAAAAA